MPKSNPKSCPICGGDGWDGGYTTDVYKCTFCKGTGKVSMVWYMRYVREFKYHLEEKS